ncbi:dUTP diphosphatase [Granulicatella sp. zg-ZJ]|uniref:dUTP diphosphatase n=1 Tax=Granulicatella sp. zg-ZJ TaxID=2678504 RepID=UPI0013D6FB1A|nr:dUTP diphosphatase [Granulicatella sp. zg-ZJ]NEW62508.1 dUTP diphosphatase [Granulicatella sp. zg-ZJ]
MKRGFEVISQYKDKNINLPKRATHKAAGYDFESAETIVLPSIWKIIFKSVAIDAKQWIYDTFLSKETQEERQEREKALKPILVPTGIKAYMQEDEYLQLTNRSSNPLKHFLVLPNGVGVIDADYYNNESNEGHIYFQMWNFGLTDKVIEKGDRIGQGIFIPFLKADNDETVGARTGGFGSSGSASH